MSGETVDDFAQFLTERYDEAEAKARAGDVGHGQWTAVEHADDGWLIVDEHHDLVANVRPERSWDGGTAAHIADTDPARRLADIKLKRAILAEHWPVDPCDAHDSSMRSTWCETVRQLGTEFSGHAGYKAEWAP